MFLYAWYCYELLVVSEMQAFGALELALKLRLLGSSEAISGLGSLLQQARQDGLLPSKVDGVDELDALLAMRNALAHGAMEFHTQICRSRHCRNARTSSIGCTRGRVTRIRSTTGRLIP